MKEHLRRTLYKALLYDPKEISIELFEFFTLQCSNLLLVLSNLDVLGKICPEELAVLPTLDKPSR